jgi:nucleotide-binding universal stress UspA family protein
MKILVPTDLSDNARNALEFAKRYAKIQDASITLIFAYYAVYDFAAQAAEIIAAIERDAKTALTKEIAENGEGLTIDYKIVQGTISTAINATVLAGDYDMIIMGTQGASGIKKTLIGSNTATVIKESEVPVIAVPAQASFAGVEKITVAVELDKEDEKLFNKFMQLTEAWNLPYSVLHVENRQDFNKDISFKGLKSFLTETYPDCEFDFLKIQAKEFEEGSNKYLDEHPNSMLVMLSKNKTFFEFLFDKSQSVKFAYHTHVPLLIVK